MLLFVLSLFVTSFIMAGPKIHFKTHHNLILDQTYWIQTESHSPVLSKNPSNAI